MRRSEQRLDGGVVLGVGHAPDARRQQHRAARHADAGAVRARAVAGLIAAAAVVVAGSWCRRTCCCTTSAPRPSSRRRRRCTPTRRDTRCRTAAVERVAHRSSTQAPSAHWVSPAAAARLARVVAAHLPARAHRRAAAAVARVGEDTQVAVAGEQASAALALARLAGLAGAAGVAARAAVLLIRVRSLHSEPHFICPAGSPRRFRRSAIAAAAGAAGTALAGSELSTTRATTSNPIRTDQSKKLCPRKAILRTETIGRASVTPQ